MAGRASGGPKAPTDHTEATASSVVAGRRYRLRAGALRAVDLRAVVFLAAVLRAGAFLAVDLRAVVFLAAVLRAVVFFAAVLRAGAFRAVAFFTAFLAAALRAVTFFAADFRTAVRFAATLLTAFLAAVFLAGLFRAEAFLAAAFFTAMDTPSLGVNADLNVEPVANRTPFDAGIGTTSPVRGFRPTRGPRAEGLNAPNPITVTFRPDRTSAMIVANNSSTTSSTIARDENVDALTALTSWDLFTITSSAIRNSYQQNGNSRP